MKKRQARLTIIAVAIVAVAVAFFWGRNDDDSTLNKKAPEENVRTSLPDTLRVATLYGPTSYFTYRDQEMGIDYEMASRFAKDNKMTLQIKVATSVPQMLEMLKKGDVDMLAYNVPRIAQYQKDLLFCGKNNVTHQVLVQPTNKKITDVTELVGKTIYVEKDSKYQYRLQNLNDELGGGIGIEAIVSDTLETADLVRMVSQGELPLTVTDSDMAEICAETFGNLDISLAVGMDQFSSWAVAKNDSLLATTIDSWIKQNDISAEYAHAHRKYFAHLAQSVIQDTESVKHNESVSTYRNTPTPKADGSISPYDAIFKKYASKIGWDWRQLAAIGYTESKFNPKIVSWAGARGLMQLMPKTAKAYGVAGRTDDPDASVYAASRMLSDLDKSLQKKVPNPEERRKFVIASYNSGLGHILDAIALADKYGKNPQVWYGNVREAVLMKTKPQYYNDPVVKHGYFRGQETVTFVDRVQASFEKFKSYN